MNIAGPLTRQTVLEVDRTVQEALATYRDDTLELDLSAVTEVDSAGAAWLAGFLRTIQTRGKQVRLVNVLPEVQRTLELLPYPDQNVAPKITTPWLEDLGARAEAALSFAFDVLVICADIAWFTVVGLFQKRGIRWRSVAYEMSALGSQAVAVVGLITFLVGGTMALQSAFQLRQFGANIFVADLVGVAMTRELGPLITAIVVAGRSGSAVAAELATMTITEEIDALKTMGLNPIRFLVLPKALAMAITQPMLTMLANVLAIFGAFIVAVTYLDVGASSFVSRLEEALMLKDLLTGLFKSVLFAILIITISAVCGLRTRGGADAVGRSTTQSVVLSIFMVIVADASASLLFYFEA